MSMIAAALLLAASQSASPAPTLRVLLVGETYANSPLGLAKLNGPNDCLLLRRAISSAYPATCTELDNAGREEIVSAWRKLAANARPGDALVFFFSGHGTLAHDSGGNVCSAIVPADAARLPNGSFDDKTLLTRDFFNSELKSLARQTRNVTLIFDSCASGLLARGSLIAKFADNPGVGSADGGRPELPPTDLDLGGAVLIAASRADRSAYEDTVQGAGVLTLALTSALGQSRPGSLNYGMLRDMTVAQLAASSSSTGQEPIFAGDLDRVVFGGNRFSTSPLVPVSMREGRITIDAGRIVGLKPGVQVGLYRAGAVLSGRPDVTVQVMEANPYTSTVKLLTGTFTPSNVGAWAFRILDPAPDAIVDVDTHLLVDRYEKYRTYLEGLPLVRKKSGASAAIIFIPPGVKTEAFDFSGTDWIAATMDGNAISHFDGSNAPDDIQQWMDETVRDVGRAQAILGLSSPNPRIEVQMELVPVTTAPSKDAEGKPYELVTSIDSSHAAGSCSAGEKERFAVRVRAAWGAGHVANDDPLKEAPYITILDITARKKVSVVWPSGTSVNPDRLRVPVDGKWHYLGTRNSFVDETKPENVSAWYFRPKEDGVGPEVFKLCATNQFVDYAPVLTRTRSDAPVDNPLARILSSFQNGAPLKRDVIDGGPPPPSQFSVAQVVISVHPAVSR